VPSGYDADCLCLSGVGLPDEFTTDDIGECRGVCHVFGKVCYALSRTIIGASLSVAHLLRQSA